MRIPILPDLSTILSFALTCLVIELTPGPNMGYLAVLGATHGRAAGYAAAAGVAMGLLMVGIAAALGLAVAISSSVLLYETLRWGGILYFLWLAREGWRESGARAPDGADARESLARYFGRGLVTNLLNPKAMLFYIAVLPTFVRPEGRILGQTLVLSGLYVLVATVIHVAIVTLSSAAHRFMQDDSRRTLLGRSLALALAGIAVWFAFSTAR
ncbi:LysE family translocator [Sulfitobacter sp. LCG007]